jgi:hypothetical protein
MEYNVNDILECVEDVFDDFIQGELYEILKKIPADVGTNFSESIYVLVNRRGYGVCLSESFINEFFVKNNSHYDIQNFDYAMEMF